jgi:16S rRNA (cytosine967-C5)-methyltransferase
VLRRRLLFSHLAQSGSGALERRLAILGWQGEPAWLQRALGPNETAWLQQVQAIDPAGLPDKLRHNLPDWLAGALREAMPPEAFGALAEALNQPAPLDLRVNTLKARREQAQAALAAAGIASEPTPYSPWGLRVAGKPALQKSAPFLAGEVEVQDEGSQLLALLVDAHRGEMVADFCAGAGGKTLALAAMMANQGMLIAHDADRFRLRPIFERLNRAGVGNCEVIAAGEAAQLSARGPFDCVVIDAPCSGSGAWRRKPDSKWRLTPKLLQQRMSEQAQVLEKGFDLLRPGGRLVYITCSVLPQENTGQVRAFLARHDNASIVPYTEQWQRTIGGKAPASADGAEAMLLLTPRRHDTDGFFVALIEKV